MPNEDIDVSNLERLEKYRSFERYRRRAEQEARAPHWWRTYQEHFVKKTGAGVTGAGAVDLRTVRSWASWRLASVFNPGIAAHMLALLFVTKPH